MVGHGDGVDPLHRCLSLVLCGPRLLNTERGLSTTICILGAGDILGVVMSGIVARLERSVDFDFFLFHLHRLLRLFRRLLLYLESNSKKKNVLGHELFF